MMRLIIFFRLLFEPQKGYKKKLNHLKNLIKVFMLVLLLIILVTMLCKEHNELLIVLQIK